MPQQADRIRYLRDVDPQALECSEADILRLVRALPDRMGREGLLRRLADENTARLEKLFESHAEPPDGYPVRGVCLFGICEALRGRDCVRPLESGDAAAFGRLMAISHDGDRVSGLDDAGVRCPVPLGVPDEQLDALIGACERGDASLAMIPGRYACSTPELDAMVDIALSVDGVAGAQLAGAGLGGCIMVLVRHDAIDELRTAMVERYYQPQGREAQIEVCVPVEGSGVFDIE